MHIEPGIVNGAKIVLSYATAVGAGAYTLKLAVDTIRESGAVSLALRSVLATLAVFSFFELLPHYPVGVSEVHFILGSTLFLVFGAAPTAFGLVLGLLAQGVFFAPFDLPQFGMNVTTLLVPLFAVSALASRIIPRKTAYVDVKYTQALALSTAFQAGVVAWVAFWALYGQGFGAENFGGIASFGGTYILVVLIEPVVDVLVLAAAKFVSGLKKTGLVTPRLYNAS